jgi:hypothetical protein
MDFLTLTYLSQPAVATHDVEALRLTLPAATPLFDINEGTRDADASRVFSSMTSIVRQSIDHRLPPDERSLKRADKAHWTPAVHRVGWPSISESQQEGAPDVPFSHSVSALPAGIQGDDAAAAPQQSGEPTPRPPT